MDEPDTPSCHSSAPPPGLQEMKIHEIKYSWKFKFYIDSNSKTSDLQN